VAITYTLKINELHIAPVAEGQADVVVRADWVYIGNNGVSTAGFGGSTPFLYTQGEPFTPYADLTENQVAGWIEASWMPGQQGSMESVLAEQLDTMVAPLPWATNDNPTP
jgi:hypothetical protein